MNQNTHGNDSIRGYVLINFMESYIQSVINKMKKKTPILNMESSILMWYTTHDHNCQWVTIKYL